MASTSAEISRSMEDGLNQLEPSGDRKKFKPFKALRRMFKEGRNKKHVTKSRGNLAGAMSDDEADDKAVYRFKGGMLNRRISLSHDSIFTPELPKINPELLRSRLEEDNDTPTPEDKTSSSSQGEDGNMVVVEPEVEPAQAEIEASQPVTSLPPANDHQGVTQDDAGGVTSVPPKPKVRKSRLFGGNATAPAVEVTHAEDDQQLLEDMEAALNSSAVQPNLNNTAAYDKIAARPKNRRANKRPRKAKRPASTGSELSTDLAFWDGNNDLFDKFETPSKRSAGSKTSAPSAKSRSSLVKEKQPLEEADHNSVKKAHSFKGPSVLPSLDDMKHIKLRKTPTDDKKTPVKLQENNAAVTSPKPSQVAPSPKPRWNKTGNNSLLSSSKVEPKPEAESLKSAAKVNEGKLDSPTKVHKNKPSSLAKKNSDKEVKSTPAKRSNSNETPENKPSWVKRRDELKPDAGSTKSAEKVNEDKLELPQKNKPSSLAKKNSDKEVKSSPAKRSNSNQTSENKPSWVKRKDELKPDAETIKSAEKVTEDKLELPSKVQKNKPSSLAKKNSDKETKSNSVARSNSNQTDEKKPSWVTRKDELKPKSESLKSDLKVEKEKLDSPAHNEKSKPSSSLTKKGSDREVKTTSVVRSNSNKTTDSKPSWASRKDTKEEEKAKVATVARKESDKTARTSATTVTRKESDKQVTKAKESETKTDINSPLPSANKRSTFENKQGKDDVAMAIRLSKLDKSEGQNKADSFKPKWLNSTPSKDADKPVSPKKTIPKTTEEKPVDNTNSKVDYLNVLSNKHKSKRSNSTENESDGAKEDLAQNESAKSPSYNTKEQTPENPILKLKKVTSEPKKTAKSPEVQSVAKLRSPQRTNNARPYSIAVTEKSSLQVAEPPQVKRNNSDKKSPNAKPNFEVKSPTADNNKNKSKADSISAVKLKKTTAQTKPEIKNPDASVSPANAEMKTIERTSQKLDEVLEAKKAEKSPAAKSPRKSVSPRKSTSNDKEFSYPAKQKLSPTTENIKSSEKPAPKWKMVKESESLPEKSKINGQIKTEKVAPVQRNKTPPKSPLKPSGFLSGKAASFNKNNSNTVNRVSGPEHIHQKQKSTKKPGNEKLVIEIQEVTSPVIKDKQDHSRTSRKANNPAPEKNEKVQIVNGSVKENDVAESLPNEEAKENHPSGSAPSWVSMARRRSKKWENIISKPTPEKSSTSNPQSKVTEKSNQDKKILETSKPPINPEKHSVSTGDKKVYETKPVDINSGPFKQASKSVDESSHQKGNIAVRSISTDGQQYKKTDLTLSASCKGDSSEIDSHQVGSPPPWLAIAMQKQKRWVREETV